MYEQKIIKACNFYVSEWHLFAALLPYLKNELKEKNKIVFISQDNLEKGMKELVQKLNINFENEKGIDEITWLSDNFILEIKEESKPVNIVVQGTISFIEDINKYLTHNLINVYKEIRIINCYEVFDSSTMLYNILDQHDKVFNTGGIHEINDVFPEYNTLERKNGKTQPINSKTRII
jgi:hypothetical protein